MALVQDILSYIKYNDFRKTNWSNQTGGGLTIDTQQKYHKWIIDITKKGTKYPTTINLKKFREMSKLFGTYNRAYHPSRNEVNYKYGDEASSSHDTATIKELFKLTAKCL